MKSKRYRPYVRRANGREMATSLKMAYRLAFYNLRGKPFYVMVQHGFPNLALQVDKSKLEIQRSIVEVHAKWSTFRKWQGKIHKLATKGRDKVFLTFP
jgi:hypothetical protein